MAGGAPRRVPRCRPRHLPRPPVPGPHGDAGGRAGRHRAVPAGLPRVRLHGVPAWSGSAGSRGCCWTSRPRRSTGAGSRADIERTKEHARGVELANPRNPGARRLARKVARKALSRERRLERQMRSAAWIADPQTRPPLTVTIPEPACRAAGGGRRPGRPAGDGRGRRWSHAAAHAAAVPAPGRPRADRGTQRRRQDQPAAPAAPRAARCGGAPADPRASCRRPSRCWTSSARAPRCTSRRPSRSWRRSCSTTWTGSGRWASCRPGRCAACSSPRWSTGPARCWSWTSRPTTSTSTPSTSWRRR